VKEKIYIDGFAGLHNFEMELNRINVLIGPQASGKSVVAKLVYFFNEVMIDYGRLLLIGRLYYDKELEINKFIEDAFKDIFNLNLIKNKFTIEYNRLALKIKISQDK